MKVNLPQKEICVFLDKDGYQIVSLILNGKQKTYKIHRLVAQFFLKNDFDYKYVNHIDGNKQNNDVSNLEWCSASENNSHAYRQGLKHRKNFSTKKREVKCFKTNKIIKFSSIADASKIMDITSGRIINAIKYKKKYKGYFWEYE